MHVAKKYSCAWTGNAIDFLREGVKIVNVADNKGRKHHVGGGVADRKAGAAPQAKVAVSVQLGTGKKQHRRRNVDSDQTSGAAIGQLV
jgi:hypothetical protein